VSPRINYTAGDYAVDARAVIEDILRREKTPLVMGGSGFYIKALFEGLGAPTVDQAIYDTLVERADREGYDAIVRELMAVDPVAASAHSINNRVKVFRALTCYLQTGRAYSSFLNDDAIDRASSEP